MTNKLFLAWLYKSTGDVVVLFKELASFKFFKIYISSMDLADVWTDVRYWSKVCSLPDPPPQ